MLHELRRMRARLAACSACWLPQRGCTHATRLPRLRARWWWFFSAQPAAAHTRASAAGVRTSACNV
jgi:hypothetical protein